MPRSNSGNAADCAKAGRFAFETTHWSMVLLAGQAENSSAAKAALETLCRAYWYPLFYHVRRWGYNATDAEDLVQDFFARILARKDLQAVKQERGRFRSYLLSALKHFLINEWKRSGAEKRGGHQIPIPLDDLQRAQTDVLAAKDQHPPDQSFDRRWALALLDRVLAQLREENRSEGREQQFNLLQDSLAGQETSKSQAEIATELGISEGALKQALFRLRQRYQKLLRAEVAHTVGTMGEVDEELRYLIAALRN